MQYTCIDGYKVRHDFAHDMEWYASESYCA